MNDELTREEREEARERFARALDQLLDAAELEQLKHAQELPALEPSSTFCERRTS